MKTDIKTVGPDQNRKFAKVSESHINTSDSSSKISLAFYSLMLWILVSLGRPQDIFPFLSEIRPAMICAGLTIALLFFDLNSDKINRNILKINIVKIYILFILFIIIYIPFSLIKTNAYEFIINIYWKNILLFFILVKMLKIKQHIVIISNVILLSVLMLSIMIIYWGLKYEEIGINRLTVGEMYDPNDIAALFVSFVPIPFLSAIYNNGIRRYLYLISFLILVFAIILTQSRGGILGLIISIFMINRKRINLRYFVMILLMSMAIAFLTPHQFWDRIKSTDISSEEIGSGRLIIWERSWHIFKEHPLGVGPNCFPSAYGRYIEEERGTNVSWSGKDKWKTAHNSYVLIAVELGILGLFLFLLLIFKSLNNFKSVIRKLPKESKIYQYAEMYYIGFIGYLICSIFLSNAYSVTFIIFFAISSYFSRESFMECAKDKL